MYFSSRYSVLEKHNGSKRWIQCENLVAEDKVLDIRFNTPDQTEKIRCSLKEVKAEKPYLIRVETELNQKGIAAAFPILAGPKEVLNFYSLQTYSLLR